MKIYVIGVGGVGGYFGGLLAKAGNDVTFVARGDNYKALKENGLIVRGVVERFTVKPIQVIEKISKIQNPQLILFAVKTYDTKQVSRYLHRVVQSDMVILTFQNGVTNDLEIKKYVSAKVYPGVAYIISTKTKPGVIEQTGGLRKLFFGDRGNQQNSALKQMVALMHSASIDATVSDNITRDLWKKFMFIVAFSGMTAICRSAIGKILENSNLTQIYEQCVKEAIVVAKATGTEVADDAFETIMKITHNTAPDSKSSLLVDIEHRRRTEIETLNGMLVKLAQEHDRPVPINQFI